jgi:hypothetical protein
MVCISIAFICDLVLLMRLMRGAVERNNDCTEGVTPLVRLGERYAADVRHGDFLRRGSVRRHASWA